MCEGCYQTPHRVSDFQPFSLPLTASQRLMSAPYPPDPRYREPGSLNYNGDSSTAWPRHASPPRPIPPSTPADQRMAGPHGSTGTAWEGSSVQASPWASYLTTDTHSNHEILQATEGLRRIDGMFFLFRDVSRRETNKHACRLDAEIGDSLVKWAVEEEKRLLSVRKNVHYSRAQVGQSHAHLRADVSPLNSMAHHNVSPFRGGNVPTYNTANPTTYNDDLRYGPPIVQPPTHVHLPVGAPDQEVRRTEMYKDDGKSSFSAYVNAMFSVNRDEQEATRRILAQREIKQSPYPHSPSYQEYLSSLRKLKAQHVADENTRQSVEEEVTTSHHNHNHSAEASLHLPPEQEQADEVAMARSLKAMEIDREQELRARIKMLEDREREREKAMEKQLSQRYQENFFSFTQHAAERYMAEQKKPAENVESIPTWYQDTDMQEALGTRPVKADARNSSPGRLKAQPSSHMASRPSRESEDQPSLPLSEVSEVPEVSETSVSASHPAVPLVGHGFQTPTPARPLTSVATAGGRMEEPASVAVTAESRTVDDDETMTFRSPNKAAEVYGKLSVGSFTVGGIADRYAAQRKRLEEEAAQWKAATMAEAGNDSDSDSDGESATKEKEKEQKSTKDKSLPQVSPAKPSPTPAVLPANQSSSTGTGTSTGRYQPASHTQSVRAIPPAAASTPGRGSTPLPGGGGDVLGNRHGFGAHASLNSSIQSNITHNSSFGGLPPPSPMGKSFSSPAPVADLSALLANARISGERRETPNPGSPADRFRESKRQSANLTRFESDYQLRKAQEKRLALLESQATISSSLAL